jgi:hypothetical protein
MTTFDAMSTLNVSDTTYKSPPAVVAFTSVKLLEDRVIEASSAYTRNAPPELSDE